LQEFHNANWDSSNMVTSLACASSWLEKYDCIVSYSDIFYNQEIIENLLIASGNLNVAYDPSWLDLWSKRFSDPLEDAETFKLCGEKKFITEIGGTASRIEEVEGQYMGLVKITPQAWNEMQRIRKNLDATKRENLHMTNLLQKVIDAKRIKINAVKYNGEWGEVDTANDLELYTSK
ncbi:phosphocholine cytidylyltransferase family protein, partial [Alphaproteobacteria bacterium]|nr:phosphocholine cytidylyltransferase family protein [Alphaproteobacteria bacterium]